MDDILEFDKLYSGYNRFSFVHLLETHTIHFNSLDYLQNSIIDFMRSFLYNGNEHYNKILLMMSDHGPRTFKQISPELS